MVADTIRLANLGARHPSRNLGSGASIAEARRSGAQGLCVRLGPGDEPRRLQQLCGCELAAMVFPRRRQRRVLGQGLRASSNIAALVVVGVAGGRKAAGV